MIDFLSTRGGLSLHHLTALDAPAEELVRIAGLLGCDHVCLFTYVPPAAHALFPCVGPDDVSGLATALRTAGVTLCNLEVFPLDADPPWAAFEESLAIGQRLGATRATVHIHDVDDRQAATLLARFCDMAAIYGITPGLEFNGFSAVRTLAQADAILRACGRGDATMVCDMLHLVRGGGDVAAARDLIAYFQLCDGPLTVDPQDRWHEAIRERALPGTGDFPIGEVLRELRPHTVIDVEVPQTAARKAGVTPLERARRAVEASRTLLAAFPSNEVAP